MRSLWTGAIGFGLVNIPIKLLSAVQNSHLDLDMLDGKDHAKIKFQRVNEQTNKVVPYNKIVKGFLVNDEYVILDEQDFEDASPEKTKLIELENFVNISDINPIYYETSYYAEPTKQGKKPYALLLKALIQSKKAGVARFVFRNTENLCVIHPLKDILVVTKIRFPEEIRDHDEVEAPDLDAVTKKELDLGLALIKQYTGDFDIHTFKDEYTKDLMKIIKAKAKGKKATVKKAKPVESSSDDLYTQLMQSLSK